MELEIIAQNPEAVPQKLLLERRSLPLPPLKLQMMDAGNGKLVAYIRLHYFTHDGTKRMASAIREGESLGVDGYSKAFEYAFDNNLRILGAIDLRHTKISCST